MFQYIKSFIPKIGTSTDEGIAVWDGANGNKLKSTNVKIDTNDKFITPVGTFESSVADTSTAIGFELETANSLTADGAKVLSAKNNGTEIFYAGIDNSNTGSWSKHAAVGENASIEKFSVLKVDGAMNTDNDNPQGTGLVDIGGSINITAAIRQAAAFAVDTKITGGGFLPFVSGMLGTGSWGANAGTWGQEPALIASRWKSKAGSSDLGAWVNNIVAASPSFSGGKPNLNYNQFSANKVVIANLIPNPTGLYVWAQDGLSFGCGIIVETCSHAGVYLAGDTVKDCVMFGAGKDASIYYDGTDLIVEPDLVGSGNLKINGGLNTTEGVKRKVTTQTSATLTLDATHHIVLCDASSNAITITLPAAASHNSREYYIKAIDATNLVTVDANGTETIDGKLTKTLALNSTMKIINNGSNWFII